MALLSATVAIPIWTAALAAAAIIVLTAVIHQLAAARRVAAIIGIAALLAAFSFAAASMFQPGMGASPRSQVAGDAAERHALEARRADLTARATMPGSPLSCLNALASEPVESACKQAVFATPTSAAVAVSYAAAQLRLLADGLAYARRSDPAYAISLADLRLAAENDAYGVYAHVLATRDRCTAEQCAAFALLNDSSTLKVHLRQRLYTTTLAEHRGRWNAADASASIAPLAAMPAAPAPATPVAIEAIAAAVATTGIGTAQPVAIVPPPLPKVRPTTTVAAGTEAPAASPASPEQPPATTEALPAAPRGVVPPVASVLPNLDFPSAASIPPISILAAEPKLPATEAAPAGSSTGPRTSARPQ
jgi:hypothetical protein